MVALAKEETVVDDNIAGHFTWANVEQWIEKGLITPEQALGIRQELEMRSPIEVASEPAQAVAGVRVLTLRMAASASATLPLA